MTTSAKEQRNVRAGLSPFVQLLGIKLDCIGDGEVSMSLETTQEFHGNEFYQVHLGVITALADTTMEAACFTLSNRVALLGMNISYMRNTELGMTLKSIAKVIQYDTAIVVENLITNQVGDLIAKGRGTFLLLDKVE